MFTRMSFSLLALALVSLVACSEAPDTEMKAAETAFAAADQAQAQQYAPELYAQAMDTLQAAKMTAAEQDSKFSLFRSYSASKELFVAAQTLVDKANTAAQEEKERVRIQVTDMAAVVKASLDSATVLLTKAPRGKGTKADLELLKGDLSAAQTAYDQAIVEITAGDYLTARTRLESVQAKVTQVSDDIAKAMKLKK
jgi:hypothetical protein